MLDRSPSRATNVQPILLLGERPVGDATRNLVAMRSTFGRTPLLIVPERRAVRDRLPVEASLLVANAGTAVLTLVAALHCRALRTNPILLVVAQDGGLTPPPTADWVSIAAAARATRALVVGARPVNWSTRGTVLEPGGPIDAARTRAVRGGASIANPRDLDTHLEMGTTLAPSGAFAATATRVVDRAASAEPDLVRRCRDALAEAARTARGIALAASPDDERDAVELALALEPNGVRVHLDGPRPTALPFVRDANGVSTIPLSGRPRSEGRVGHGMIWRMPRAPGERPRSVVRNQRV